MVAGGQNNSLINHYSILRTIEDMYSLTAICNASTSSAIQNIWISTGLTTADEPNPFIVSPNPSSGQIFLKLPSSMKSAEEIIQVTDIYGKQNWNHYACHYSG